MSHFRNFFDAIRAGKRDLLTAEINETYTSTAITLLGNISYRLKRELRFDPVQQRFTGDQEADAIDRLAPIALRSRCRIRFEQNIGCGVAGLRHTRRFQGGLHFQFPRCAVIPLQERRGLRLRD